MQILETLVLSLYVITLVLTVLYSLGQFHLLITFLRHRRKVSPVPPLEGEELPFVTVQLPIYNELYVVERLLEAVASLDYPKERFEVQLLDDSTDETFTVAARKVEAIQARGIQIEHIRRPNRVGYKAGALAYGLDFAKGDFIAIFDADFLPRPSFLRSAMAHFTHERVGVVQARWEHLNKDYSFFTEAQAFHLDAHFTIEQFSRDAGGFFLNFNGTAGIWRKECILDAGGWESDTLTEDLDLSYRAQLRGWKFRYVDDITAPAELPAEMGAIKSQQYRWMKGGAEVARKMLFTLWRSQAPLVNKIHGSLHLMSSSVFLLVLLLGATSVPLLYLKHTIFGGNIDFLTVPVTALLCSFIVLGAYYITTLTWRERSFSAALKRFLLNFIPFLSFSMGLSLHNSLAVISGFRGKKSPFVRTPKFDIKNRDDDWKKVKYKTRKVDKTVYAELLLMLYFTFGVFLTFKFKDFSIMPFMLMEMFGFGMVGWYSFRHVLLNRG